MLEKMIMPNKKVLIFIANNNFRDEEYFEPKKILENNSIATTTIGLEIGTATGSQGGQASCELDVDYLLENQDRLMDYVALIFIGGSGMSELVDNEKLFKLTQAAADINMIIGAICVAPVLLARAGILRQKKATVFPDQENIEDLVNNGAEYTGEEITQDSNIITANGPKSCYKFGLKLVSVINAT